MSATQSNIFQVSSEIPYEHADAGIVRQIFGYDEKLMLVKVRFDKGAVGVLHRHVHSQASYVESGVFEVTIGDDKKILKAGDGFFIPSDVQHGCFCLEAGQLIDVFSPLREEFIK